MIFLIRICDMTDEQKKLVMTAPFYLTRPTQENWDQFVNAYPGERANKAHAPTDAEYEKTWGCKIDLSRRTLDPDTLMCVYASTTMSSLCFLLEALVWPISRLPTRETGLGLLADANDKLVRDTLDCKRSLLVLADYLEEQGVAGEVELRNAVNGSYTLAPGGRSNTTMRNRLRAQRQAVEILDTING